MQISASASISSGVSTERRNVFPDGLAILFDRVFKGLPGWMSQDGAPR